MHLLFYLVFHFIIAIVLTIVLLVVVCFVNSLRPPARRVRMRRWVWLGMPLFLTLGMFLLDSIGHSAEWRRVAYSEMSAACEDHGMLRAKFWLMLGASPDGAVECRSAPSDDPLWFQSHLETAVEHDDLSMLRFLLGKGADPSFGGESSPLSTAIREHDLEAVKILLAAGADPRGYSSFPGFTALDHAKHLGFDDLIPIIQPYLKP